MKKLMQGKAPGTYFALLAGVLALIAGIFFLVWAPAHNAMNIIIPAALFVGVVLEILLFFVNIEYIAILATALYSVALFQLLSDSVGSFVDALQGIVMFGDASQIGTILTMSALILVAALASILSCFVKRVSAA